MNFLKVKVRRSKLKFIKQKKFLMDGHQRLQNFLEVVLQDGWEKVIDQWVWFLQNQERVYLRT